MRIQCSGGKELRRLVDVLRAVDRELVVTWAARGAAEVVEDPDGTIVAAGTRIEPGDDADPLDRLARRAGRLADALGIPRGDTALLRPLRDEERRIRPGEAPSLPAAEAWLREIAAGCPAPVSARVVDSFVERLAPALLPLSAMNAHYLRTHTLTRFQKEHRRFFDFVEARCADPVHARVQARFLDPRALQIGLARIPASATDYIRGEKYLHAPHWLSSKLEKHGDALRVASPLAVLDLGSGPAHFGLVCAYHGHHYHGLDVPYSSTTPFSDHDLYGDLFDAFGLGRSLQRIEAHTPLQVDRRYDRVTCLMGNFCVHRTPAGPVPWQWPAWDFFLRDLDEHVLAPRAEIFLQINREMMPAEVLARFADLGAEIDAERSIVRLRRG